MVVLLALVMRCAVAHAQGEAVTLQELVSMATSDHPLMRSAREEVVASEFDITAAQRRWWPTISIDVESNAAGSSATGARALSAEQTIWDGGQTAALITRARAENLKSSARVLLQKQQLALQVISGWQSFISARDKIVFARESMERLRVYEEQMRRRVVAQASAQIDLDFVLSRIRQTEVDLSSANAGLNLAAQRLKQLTGKSTLADSALLMPHWPEPGLVSSLVGPMLVEDLEQLALASVAVQVAQGDVRLLAAQLDAKRAQNWPTLYVRLHRALGSASPAVSVDRGTSLFFGMRYTLGTGFSTGIEAEALAVRMAAASEAAEAAYLEQREMLAADHEEFRSAERQRAALEGAVVGAKHVLRSYSDQFVAGRKTWIDLLNALRELSQNQFALADAQATMMSAFYRMQVRRQIFSLQPQ